MAPTPFPQHTACLILKYISPLSEALPSHLLSSALRNRHRFLSISPSDPTNYLCWPKPDRDQSDVVGLLTRPTNDDAFSCLVQYVSDGDEGDTFAHVCIRDAAGELDLNPRLVFQWEEPDGWKYHDVALMPFPTHSYPSLEAAFQAASDPSLEFVVEGKYSPQIDTNDVSASRDDEDDDGAYWNAYGAGDDSHGLQSRRHSRLLDDKQGIQNEDSYWAQYASVQGTADSTVPSPLPLPRSGKLREHVAPHLLIPPSPNSRSLSPGTLIELLNTLPQCEGDFDSETCTGETSPLSTRDYIPDSLSHDVAGGRDFAEEGTDGTIVVDTSMEKPERITLILPPKPTKDLKKRVQNIYRAWTDGQDSDGGAVQDSREDFLNFVRDALSEL